MRSDIPRLSTEKADGQQGSFDGTRQVGYARRLTMATSRIKKCAVSSAPRQIFELIAILSFHFPCIKPSFGTLKQTTWKIPTVRPTRDLGSEHTRSWRKPETPSLNEEATSSKGQASIEKFKILVSCALNALNTRHPIPQKADVPVLSLVRVHHLRFVLYVHHEHDHQRAQGVPLIPTTGLLFSLGTPTGHEHGRRGLGSGGNVPLTKRHPSFKTIDRYQCPFAQRDPDARYNRRQGRPTRNAWSNALIGKTWDMTPHKNEAITY